MGDEALFTELEQAEVENTRARPCQACVALSQMGDRAKASTERALAGTIGQNKLADILTRNGYKVGARAIIRHRREGHTS